MWCMDQEMVFDAHDRAFACFRGACTRGIYSACRWSDHALALMGVRCLYPHNIIDLAGLVVDQASQRRLLPLCHQCLLRSHRRVGGDPRRASQPHAVAPLLKLLPPTASPQLAPFSTTRASMEILILSKTRGQFFVSFGGQFLISPDRRSCWQARPVPAALDERLQPNRTTILALCEPANHRSGAVNHLSPQIMIGTTANSAETGLAAGCGLSRHQSDPCRQFTS